MADWSPASPRLNAAETAFVSIRILLVHLRAIRETDTPACAIHKVRSPSRMAVSRIARDDVLGVGSATHRLPCAAPSVSRRLCRRAGVLSPLYARKRAIRRSTISRARSERHRTERSMLSERRRVCASARCSLRARGDMQMLRARSAVEHERYVIRGGFSAIRGRPIGGDALHGVVLTSMSAQ